MARTAPQQDEFDRIADEVAPVEVSKTISEEEDDLTVFDPDAPEVTVTRGGQAIYSDMDKLPLNANTTQEDKSAFKRMKAVFAKSKPMTIVLFQNPPGQDQLPPEDVSINDYHFIIRRGEQVTVPEEVYLILVQTGRIAPMRKQDHVHTPRHFFDLDKYIADMRKGILA